MRRLPDAAAQKPLKSAKNVAFAYDLCYNTSVAHPQRKAKTIMAHSSKKNLLITRYLTLLKNEFRGYGASSLLSDFVAGITVGAVALPLALAFGAASVIDSVL